MLQSLPELARQLDYVQAKNCKRLHSLSDLPSLLGELDASILHKLSKQVYKGPRRCNRTLDFTNCMNFGPNKNSNILANSQLRIQHMTSASLRHSFEGAQNSLSLYIFLLIALYHNSWFLNYKWILWWGHYKSKYYRKIWRGNQCSSTTKFIYFSNISLLEA